jgi:hypothetical protein
MEELSPLPHRVQLAYPRDVHSAETFQDHVYELFVDIAMSMQCEASTCTELAWRLYRQVSRQGKKRRGHYEVQLPHLLRVVNSELACNDKGRAFGVISRESHTRHIAKQALLARPSSGVCTGLYLCSLELELSNPWWRLESTEYDEVQNRWVLDDMLSQIPTGHPTNCEFILAINILQYTAPYELPWALQKPTAAAWSWLPARLEQARAEFNKVFYAV